MRRRCFVDQLGDEPQLMLSPRETHHLQHVLRRAPGDEVQLFDGTGREATARIAAFTAEGARLEILARQIAETESATPIVLGVAVPKGDRFKWLVEKATELGVARLVPLITSRSVVDPREGKIDRLRQTIVEAGKQARRSRLMQLDAPVAWEAFVAREVRPGRSLIADPQGEPFDPARVPGEGSFVAAIGPEGGFTSDELAAGVAAGAQLVALTPHILRIETAALACATLCLALPRHP